MAPPCKKRKSMRGSNFEKPTPSTSVASDQNQDQDHKPTSTELMATDMHPPHQVDPDGDIILFTREASLIDISKGNVPGNYARFQVSSKHLTLASGYFKRMLKNCWAEGVALSTKGSVEIPVNDCKPDILLIILNLIHGRSRQVPLKLSLPQLTDIAVATDFFECHEAIEVFAGIWIKDLESLVSSSFSENTKEWIMIAWVFKSNDILRQTETIAMQQGTGPFQTSNLPIPKSIKDKIDQARQKYMESLQVKFGQQIEKLLNSPNAKHTSCGPECNATYLGLVLRTLTHNKISYSAGIPSLPDQPYSPFVAVSLENLSPTSVISMVKSWDSLNNTSSKSEYCGPYKYCENRLKPFGNDATSRAQNLPTSL
ncbi:hypothetical protein N7471_007925 [Penicillium samsonianum]|uniref:uncharacterized protein n=1 Tax=Penicillium samsonianum TaxID=1882272 RepID=UPI002546FBE6|nr:uncharacterized protein N7471_007925 [Penicillium samsonianum]KAJ6132710.1 hypothetical protein N7471_007925 [Penicillium samsonianum]